MHGCEYPAKGLLGGRFGLGSVPGSACSRQDLIYFAVAMAGFLCHDIVMGKRSSRMAKRDDFEKAIRTAEAAIGSRAGKNPAGAVPDRQDELKDGKAGRRESRVARRGEIAH